MALGRTITLSSEVRGQLVDGTGTPQPGITIRQSWSERPEDPEQTVTTVTDAQGRFRFPAVQRRSLAAVFLPGTPSILQNIVAERPDGPLTLWMHVRTSHRPQAEVGEASRLELICRIDAREDGAGPAWGTCRLAGG